MLFDRHEMGRPMTGGRRRVDVIANQQTSAWNEQAVKLRIKLGDTARVTKLVHGLQRDDQIEAGRNRVCGVKYSFIAISVTRHGMRAPP